VSGASVDGEPATRERWGELVDLFERPGPRGGTPITAGCWCQYWHVRGKAYHEGWDGSPTLARVDDEPVWSVVCFYVHPTAKRQGVASALLEGALDHAASRGAAVVEGYSAQPGHPNIDSYTRRVA
jgi:GNAT superfamily N-acetyltransferase